MFEKKVFIKEGKERSIKKNRHPWIFSGAIESYSEEMLPGEIASVYSFDQEFLACAYFHPTHSLAGRILSFEKKPVYEILEDKVKKAIFLRSFLIDPSKTNCYRLINSEEDGLPGLVVDVYGSVLSFQVNTCGMDLLREKIVKILQKEVSCRAIYERSTSRAREQEGLAPQSGWVYGEEVLEIEVKENGIPFFVSVVEGQKTGFFLDQREMRKKVGELSKGLHLLNCFSYSGGFSLYALKGGVEFVTSVDTCPRATALCKKNTQLSGFTEEKHQIVQKDVFDFLQETDLSQYGLIILDPPAFAKRRQEIEAAFQGYLKMNQTVMERCKPGTFLLTCSCSYFMDGVTFQKAIFQAASSAQREVKILSKHIQSADHPISLYHPEGEYLKSFLLWIE